MAQLRNTPREAASRVRSASATTFALSADPESALRRATRRLDDALELLEAPELELALSIADRTLRAAGLVDDDGNLAPLELVERFEKAWAESAGAVTAAHDVRGQLGTKALDTPAGPLEVWASVKLEDGSRQPLYFEEDAGVEPWGDATTPISKPKHGGYPG